MAQPRRNSHDECIFYVRYDMISYAEFAEDSQACFDAFSQALECDTRAGTCSAPSCREEVDLETTCVEQQGDFRAQIPDDARASLTPFCDWRERSCSEYDPDFESCLVEWYALLQIAEYDSGEKCSRAWLGLLDCAADSACSEDPCPEAADAVDAACQPGANQL